jgi:SpoVK/Ycf46/Vps4 family AAA+-type ATPase
VTESSELFELELPLPDAGLHEIGMRLIGFEKRYQQLGRAFEMLLDPASADAWARKHHGPDLPIVKVLGERYPLVILHGDVGTGKTAFAEAAADRLCRSPRREGTLMKLSTRVRGVGKVGELSHLINEAFAAVEVAVGRERAAILIIDEADSLAASRGGSQSHHEDKVGVNTLIQKIDDIRRLDGRLLVFLCTNRLAAIDPALQRRAGYKEEFQRPDPEQRRALLEHDLEGVGVSSADIESLVKLTAARDSAPGFTFSDLRTRLIPVAVQRAFPDRPLSGSDLIKTAEDMTPSPSFDQSA